MNRIQQKLQEDKKLLSLYFTAGYPAINDTITILQQLQDSGVDMVEIGLPFSDPLADGPTIQESSTAALKNGMTTQLLFDQLKDVRKTILSIQLDTTREDSILISNNSFNHLCCSSSRSIPSRSSH